MPARTPPVRLALTALERRDTPSRLAYTPADVRAAYGLAGLAFTQGGTSTPADGAGQTIAVVTAYGSPTAAEDLAEFSRRFGLPDPDLTVLDGDGNRRAKPAAPPAGLGAWATETAADLQWAHAVAPAARLVLVTAHGHTDADLMQAVETARAVPGVGVVSMSFGRGEFPGQAAFDSAFTGPGGRGVSFVAASGDTAGVGQFLAFSPRVVGVGGTTLTLSADNRYQGEAPWRAGPAGSGGGFSRYAYVPGFQRGEVNYPEDVRPMRGGPDVSWVADKLWVYDRSGTAAGPWLVSSGTSLAAPMWAGLLAVANQGRALGGAGTLDGATQTLPLLYSAPAEAFRDVADPSYPASGPWDWTTGLGTPVVAPLLTHLLQGAGGVAVAAGDGSSSGGGGSGGTGNGSGGSGSGGSGGSGGSSGGGTGGTGGGSTGGGSTGGSTGGGSTGGGSSGGSSGGSTGGSGGGTGGPGSGGSGAGGNSGGTGTVGTPKVGGVGGIKAGGLVLAAGTGWGEPATVTAFDPATGRPVFTATPFGTGFTGGVRVAGVDLTGGGAGVLAGSGPGMPSRVVLLGAAGQSLALFQPFEDTFTGGVFVAAGDLDGDGVADFVATPDEGGGPRVQVVSGATGHTLADFFGIEDEAFRGGARAAVGDLNGDGANDLIVAAGYGGGPRIAIYDGRTVGRGDRPARLVGDFFAMDPNLRNGLYVAAGDVLGRGRDDLLLGAGPGGAPRVLAVDGRALAADGRLVPLADFYAGDSRNRGGAPVAVTRLADGTAAVAVGSGRGRASARVYTPAQFRAGDPAAALDLPLDKDVAVGVYVG